MMNTTAVVTDSAAYLPAEVIDQFGISVVPMTVVVDGTEHQEFVDLNSADFYGALNRGATVSTSQPSPGKVLEVYERLAARGAERIISMHIGSALSGTMNSARLAAEMAPLPVHLIDTGQASFIEGLCVWEGCEVLTAGGRIEDVEAAVTKAGKAAGNVFIVRGLQLLKAGGRLDAGAESAGAVPVLALENDAIRPIGSADSVEDAMNKMIGWLETAIAAAPGKRFRVGVANGDADVLAAELEARVRKLEAVETVVPYTIGPAVGAHTGSGCTGMSFLARPV